LHHIYELAYLMFCPWSVFFALQDCDFWIVNWLQKEHAEMDKASES
jgi:hypothetical protein